MAHRRTDRPRARRPVPGRPVLGEYALATLAALLALALAAVADRYLSVASLSLIFLTAVLAVAVRTRMAVAVYTAVLCFLGYNFFFTPPRHTLMIADADDLLAVSLFLVAALVCSRLATRLASQVESLRAAQARSRAMLQLGQRLAGSVGMPGVRQAGAEAMAHALDARVSILAREGDDAPLQMVAATPEAQVLAPEELAAAEWCDRHARPAGRGEGDMPAVACWVVPLGDASHRAGVAALHFDGVGPDADRRALALAMARDIGLALERARLAAALEE